MSSIWFRKLLGDLERNIMEIMWRIETATIRDVYEELRVNRRIAYTTVMTIMNRLCDKGLLRKDCNESAFVYSTRMSRDEFIHLLICEILDVLAGGGSKDAVSHIVSKLVKEKPSIKRIEKDVV